MTIFFSDQKYIFKHVSLFTLYSYSTQDQDYLAIFFSHIQFLKSSDSKNNLDTKSEILGSLKDLKFNKTPGYDGLPVEFYVVFFMIYSLKLLPVFFSARFYVYLSEK